MSICKSSGIIEIENVYTVCRNHHGYSVSWSVTPLIASRQYVTLYSQERASGDQNVFLCTMQFCYAHIENQPWIVVRAVQWQLSASMNTGPQVTGRHTWRRER